MSGLRAVLTADSALNLGRISGIRFRIHFSWFIILLLVIYMLSQEYFPSLYPGWSRPAYVLSGTVAALVFFASVVAHELAHSFVARANGMPVRSITLFIFGGVAQITREARKPGEEMVMAAAGPACSLVIGGVCGLLWFATHDTSRYVSAVLSWLAGINIGLAVFNLIPGFPLDGGRIFHALLWKLTRNYRRSIRIATLVGQGMGYIIISVGIIVGIGFPFDGGRNLDPVGGVWLALVGWFLATTASASYRQLKGRHNLVGLKASQVMTSNYRVVPAETSLERLMEQQTFLTSDLTFLVAGANTMSGMVTMRDVMGVARDSWNLTTLQDITPQGFTVTTPEQDVLSVLELLEESGRNQAAVISDGRVVGVVARDTLMGLAV